METRKDNGLFFQIHITIMFWDHKSSRYCQIIQHLVSGEINGSKTLVVLEKDKV